MTHTVVQIMLTCAHSVVLWVVCPVAMETMDYSTIDTPRAVEYLLYDGTLPYATVAYTHSRDNPSVIKVSKYLPTIGHGYERRLTAYY